MVCPREFRTITSQGRMRSGRSRLRLEFMHGVKVRFLNREDLLERLRALAQQLTRENRRVMGVHLLGSLARGNHAPGSDADIFILL
jgi:predicted nucleotidyltransferase